MVPQHPITTATREYDNGAYQKLSLIDTKDEPTTVKNNDSASHTHKVQHFWYICSH